MEVCGTHTMSIFRHGIRSVLPESISLLSGPGCPVCVTDQSEIDAFIQMARIPNVTIATFGDLIRVPGSGSSLERERAEGRDVRVVYSPMDALEIARTHKDRQVVFLGVGFETTAPTVAATLMTAAAEKRDNFLIFSAHKRVTPALRVLLETENIGIDGFLLPGHVSVIIGTDAYQPVFDRHPIPCVVAGFEPVDILAAVHQIIGQIVSGNPQIANAYVRAVTAEGNPKALQLMAQMFEPVDACWRGMGMIPQSGLGIRSAYENHDALKVLDIELETVPEPRGCACGEIITGLKTPLECPLFRKRCSPVNPIGPCMVSSEGTCAAYYRYHV